MRLNWFSRRPKAAKRDAVPQFTVYERRALEQPGLTAGVLPYQTYDQMQGDSMVQTVLTVKKLGILATSFSIKPASSSDSAKAKADFIEEAFDRMEGSPNTILAGAMDAFAKGWSVQEAIYSSGMDFQSMVSRISNPGSGPHIWLDAIRPKDPSLFGLDVDAYGNVTSLKLRLPGQPDETLPREKFVLWANRDGYRQPKGRSDLDAAYPHWKAKQSLLAAWKLHLERFAMPTVLGKFERGLSVDEQASLVTQLRDLSQNVAIVFPSEIDISTLGVGKEQSQGFMDALDFHNREIARAVLGQTLTTDEGRRVGSLAMGKVHLQVLLLQLESLRRELADKVMTEQIIRPLTELNFGPGEIPRFEFAPLRLDAFATGQV
jgi:hypothetical protein